MRYELIHRHDLDEAARQAGFRDVTDIELGVMETDGTFSFFRRESGVEDSDGDDSSERGVAKVE